MHRTETENSSQDVYKQQSAAKWIQLKYMYMDTTNGSRIMRPSFRVRARVTLID